MRVLITGVNGYVAGAVARSLASRGHRIVAWLRSTDDARSHERAGHEIVRGELTDTERLGACAAEVDAVFHGVASQDPAFVVVNERAIDALLNGLRVGTGFAVQAGSAVFGDTGGPAHARVFDGTESPNPPPSLAAQSALERRVLARGARGVRPYVVYAALVYGGAGAMIPNLLVGSARRAGAGQTNGPGDNRWSAVHVDDWAELVALLLERGPAEGGPFVASSSEWSLADVASAVAEAVGTPGTVERLTEEEAARQWGFFAPLLAANQRFTSERAAAAVGWSPRSPALDVELRILAARNGT